MTRGFDFHAFGQQCRREYAADCWRPHRYLAALHERCEELLQRHQPDRSARLDCRPGCGICCIVNVAVLLPEALAIVEFVDARPEAFAGLDERLNLVWHQVRGVVDDERVCMRVPCVFLDDAGSCSIYPVRPLLCRGVTSTNADVCRASLNANLFNEQIAVRMSLFQHELYDRAFLGLSAGLEARELDGRSFELTGIVRYLLRNPRQRIAVRHGYRLEWGELA